MAEIALDYVRSGQTRVQHFCEIPVTIVRFSIFTASLVPRNAVAKKTKKKDTKIAD